MNKINEEEFKEAAIIIETYFMNMNWNVKVLLDPYTNYPFIKSIIHRKIANQFLGEKEYQHPNGAWQYFKQKYFPRWLKNIFPIQMKIIEFSFRAVFPNYKPTPEQLKQFGNWLPDVSIQKY